MPNQTPSSELKWGPLFRGKRVRNSLKRKSIFKIFVKKFQFPCKWSTYFLIRSLELLSFMHGPALAGLDSKNYFMMKPEQKYNSMRHFLSYGLDFQLLLVKLGNFNNIR